MRTSYHTYVAKDGKVFVRESNGELREVIGALSANGRDLARFQAALDLARIQREEMKK